MLKLFYVCFPRNFSCDRRYTTESILFDCGDTFQGIKLNMATDSLASIPRQREKASIRGHLDQ